MIDSYLKYIKEESDQNSDIIIVDSKTGEVFIIDKFTFFDNKKYIKFNAKFNCLMFNHDNFYDIFPNAKKEDYEPYIDEKNVNIKFGKDGPDFKRGDRVKVDLSTYSTINHTMDFEKINTKGTIVDFIENKNNHSYDIYVILMDEKNIIFFREYPQYNIPDGRGCSMYKIYIKALEKTENKYINNLSRFKNISPYADTLKYGKSGVHFQTGDRIEIKVQYAGKKNRKAIIVDYNPKNYLYLICFDDKVNSKSIGSEFNIPTGHGELVAASCIKRILKF